MTYPLVKFGDVVRQVKDKVDPQTAGLERYVAGEHMDTDNLHIRRWGDVGAGYLGPAFHMRFQPGQILYGSRRTYLRKIAVADFEGITANTTYVIEPKDPEVLLPDFLPFVMSTERFHEHSIKQSKGSVNPYINFSDITWYEFPLPPVDEQRRIADLLWAADDVCVKYEELQNSLQQTVNAVAFDQFNQILKSDIPLVRVSEISSRFPQTGLYKKKDFYGSGIPTVHMGEMFAYDCIDKTIELQRIELNEKEIEIYRLTDNDLLFGRRSLVLEGAGRCAYVGELDEPICFESSMLRVTFNKEAAYNRYIFEWFRSPQGVQRVGGIVTFTTVAGVKGADVARLQIPLPDLKKQREIIDKIDSVKSGVKSTELALSAARNLKKELLEKSFRE